MAESHKDRVNRYDRYVKNATAMLTKLDHKTIEYLVRASEETSEIDGYGSNAVASTSPSEVKINRDDPLHARATALVKSKSSSDGKPVEAALLRMACPKCKGEGKVEGETRRCKTCGGTGKRHTDDPLLYALDEIFLALTDIGGGSSIIDRKLPIVLEAASKLHAELAPDNCKACHRLVARTSADPIRGGYCSACSTAWYRWKSDFSLEDVAVARTFFEAQREKFDGHLASACVVCIELEELGRIAVEASA